MAQLPAQLPTAVGGEAADTPQAPANPPAFPPVHAMPPSRPVPVMTDAEQKQAEAELIAARDRQTKPAQKQVQRAKKKPAATTKQASPKPVPEPAPDQTAAAKTP